MGDAKRTLYAIRPQGTEAWCLCDDILIARDHIDDGNPGDVWEVRAVEMSEAEADALPEFDGW